MIHKLKEGEYERVLSVLEGMDFNLSVYAVVEGTCPGWIYVDDVVHPEAAFISSPEGHYVVGNENNQAFNVSLKELITESILPKGKEAGWLYFCLFYFPDTWEETLDVMFKEYLPVKDYQEFYAFKQLRVDWKDRVPSGFSMNRVDEKLLSRTDLKNVNSVAGWAKGNFGSISDFVKKGFGFCLLHEHDMVSWCMADCVSENKCEIGIHTDEEYRKRGFATLTVATTVDYCISNNLTHIGWHCWSHNVGSAATARKVGFEKVLDHYAFKIWLNPFDNLLVHGNMDLMRQQFKEAAGWYERAFKIAEAEEPGVLDSHLFSSRGDQGRYYWKAACTWALAGERDASIRNLNKALDRGSYRQGAY